MSEVSKLAVQVAMDITVEENIDYIIFTSQHGELKTTLELLVSCAKGEPLSPTAFSQSVHNTASGLFTITTKRETPSTSGQEHECLKDRLEI